MKKIWNGLRYGDTETRKCIGSVIGFSLAAVVCIVAAGLRGQLWLFAIAMIFGVIAIVISQTFTLEDEDFVAEVNRSGEKETVRAVMAQKNTREAVTTDETENNTGAAGRNDDRTDAKPHAAEDKEKEIDIYQHYDQHVLRKVKRKYRVKKDHRPILVDESRTYRIRECPAFIWRVHNKVYLLLLEKEPRKICISRDLIRNMGYRPGVKVNMEEEYPAFRKENLITGVFREFLPDYMDSKIKNDPLKTKNLYTIYPDIMLTNRCAYEVMDLLCLHFMPKDKITDNERLNGFFKRIYAANILYRDRVYSILEYKNSIEKTLHDLCYAEMTDKEFEATLEQLLRGRLISGEYADHYRELRYRIK